MKIVKERLAALNVGANPLPDLIRTVVYWNRRDGVPVGRHRPIKRGVLLPVGDGWFFDRLQKQ